MKKLLLPLLSIVLIVVGCLKGVTPYTETPMQSIYTTDTLVDSSAKRIVSSFEFGYEFHSSATCTVTELGCIAPVKDSIYRLSLWDVPTQTLLATVNVHATDSLHFAYGAITPVSIEFNHDYLVSISNYNAATGGLPLYLLYNKAHPSTVFLPYTIGDISIDANFGTPCGATPTFPTTSTYSYFLIPVDIGFQPK